MNFVMPKDIATTSSKSDVDSCSHGQDSDHQKCADGQTDRQTAFQLYIVDNNMDTADEGEYICNVANNAGNDSKNITVYSKLYSN